MYYQVNGDISCQVPTPYYHVLEFWIEKCHFEHIVFLFPTKIRINGLLELYEMQDLFCFLNQFATISHATLLATRRNNEHLAFQLHDGLIHEYPYIYHIEKPTIKPFSHFIQTIQEKNFRVHIPLEQFSNEELDAFETAILTIKHQKKENFKDEIATLASFVKRKQFIELSTEQEKIRWDNEASDTIFSFPLGISDEGYPVQSERPVLAAYFYDEQELRQFKWGDVTFPLHSFFLADASEKNVQLPTGEMTNACSQCLFRLRNLTSGCHPCTPNLVAYNHKPPTE